MPILIAKSAGKMTHSHSIPLSHPQSLLPDHTTRQMGTPSVQNKFLTYSDGIYEGRKPLFHRYSNKRNTVVSPRETMRFIKGNKLFPYRILL